MTQRKHHRIEVIDNCGLNSRVEECQRDLKSNINSIKNKKMYSLDLKSNLII